MRIFLANDHHRLTLLRAIASGSIQPSSLTWGQTVSLLNSRNPEVRSLAREHLQGNELNADAVWQDYQESLVLHGKVDMGQAVFKQHCGICHQKSGTLGIAFGPDLASVQNRNKTSLLVDILQPNRSIADGFELWTVELVSGKSFSGVVSQQSPTALTIRDATGKEETFNREDIEIIKASELSAMPENLHAGINHQEMADLLAFLKGD
jgi:putative heme-binding domain-containing protein